MITIYRILLFCVIATGITAMEKRKELEELEESEAAKKARIQPAPAQERVAFEQLPTDVKNIILSFLVTAPGRTDRARLEAAAENIRNFMTLNRAFRRYLNDERVNGHIIQQLAQRYTNRNLVEAAIALRTAAGSRWLRSYIQSIANNLGSEVIIDQIRSALIHAAGFGDIQTVSFIVKSVPDIFTYGIAGVFVMAAQNGHIAMINFLLDHGAIVTDHDERGRTALNTAIRNGHIAVVNRLIELPQIIVNINLRDMEGDTALHVAAIFGNLAIVEQLLAIPGIDVNIQNRDGWTPLMYAVEMINRSNSIKMSQLLLSAPGINVNAQNNFGTTALMFASFRGHEPIVERMLAIPDINVNRRDNLGRTALSYANNSASSEKGRIVTLLQKHGAVE